MCSNASAVESVEQPGLAAPAPELAGLLDDSFATMLEEILVSKNPFGGVQLSDCPEPALLNNLAPGPDSALSLPSFPQQQGPRMPSESEQPDVWSFDKKGNGSGESRSAMPVYPGQAIDHSAKRQKAHQDKNKRAQRKYRERKKAESEEQNHQIKTLTAQLEHLTASKSQLESRCQLLEKVVKMREDPAPSSSQVPLEVQHDMPAYVTATATFLSLTYPNQGLDRSLTQEHIDLMDGRDFLKVMYDFRARLVQLMVDANDDPSTPVYKQIEELVESQKWAIECIILNNPAKMMRVAYQVRQLPDQNGVCNFQVDPLVQRRVLAALQLSKDKKQCILENRQRLLLNLEQLLRKQNTVAELMQTSMPMRYDNFSDAQAFLKVTVAVSDFTANLHKHHGAVRDFMLELLSSVLTPYEEARCHVETWPQYPDALMISNIIAEELRDSTANAKLLQPDRHPTAVKMPEMLQLEPNVLDERPTPHPPRY